MPPRRQSKSLQSICFDSILIFSLIVLLGNLIINICEQHTIQNELSSMKKSVHKLKDTINGIGKAYDNLHSNLNHLFKIVDQKQPLKNEPICKHCKQAEFKSHRCKNTDCTLIKKEPDFRNLNSVFTLLNQADYHQPLADRGTETIGRENKKVGPKLKNGTTNTRNPLKSTAMSSEFPKSNIAQFVDR